MKQPCAPISPSSPSYGEISASAAAAPSSRLRRLRDPPHGHRSHRPRDPRSKSRPLPSRLMTAPLHDQLARDRFQMELDANFCVSAGAGVGKTTAIVRRVAELARRDPERPLPSRRRHLYPLRRRGIARSRPRAAPARRGRGGDRTPKRPAAPLPPGLFRHHPFLLPETGPRIRRRTGHRRPIPPSLRARRRGRRLGPFLREPHARRRPARPRRPRRGHPLPLLRRTPPPRPQNRSHAGRTPPRLRRAPEPRPPFDFTASLAESGGRSPDTTRDHQEMLRRFLTDFAEGAAYLRIPVYSGGGKKFLQTYQSEMFPFASWLDRQAARLASRIALGYRDYRREQRPHDLRRPNRLVPPSPRSPAILEQLRAPRLDRPPRRGPGYRRRHVRHPHEVTRPPGAPVGEWPAKTTAAAPRPGRFCFVGDEQQSIFASRANLAVYRQYIDAFDAGVGGERLEFSVTMRCPQRIIGAINAIFFQAGRLRQTHFSFRELHPKPNCVEGAAWLLPIRPLAEDKPKVEAAFQRNAARSPPF